MINFDEKIKEKFKMETIREYNKEKVVGNYCLQKKVINTDGNFVQIGIRPQIPPSIFNSLSLEHGIIGLSNQIAIGEEKYFIENILLSVKSKELEKEDITQKLLIGKIKEINKSNEVIIFVPLFFSEGMIKLLGDYMVDNSKERYAFKIGKINVTLYWIRDKFIENNIIIYDKENIIWKQKNVDNEIIEVNIQNPSETKTDKYDVLVRVIVKQEINLEGINIIKII